MKFVILFFALVVYVNCAPQSNAVPLNNNQKEDDSNKYQNWTLKEVKGKNGSTALVAVAYGNYTTVGKDGVPYLIRYVADEYGFRAETINIDGAAPTPVSGTITRSFAPSAHIVPATHSGHIVTSVPATHSGHIVAAVPATRSGHIVAAVPVPATNLHHVLPHNTGAASYIIPATHLRPAYRSSHPLYHDGVQVHQAIPDHHYYNHGNAVYSAY